MSARPYRDNVAAVVLDNTGRVLVGWKHNAWQLPQGGVRDGESFHDALKRELSEEIGSDKFRIINESEHFYCYEWPEGVETKKKKKYRGQRQRYFLVRFKGDDADLDPHTHGEFKDLDWCMPQDVLENAWDVKRPVYAAAFREFELIR